MKKFLLREISIERIPGLLILVVMGFMLTGLLALMLDLKTPNQNSSNLVVEDTCAASQNLTFGCYKDQLTRLTDNQDPMTAFALLKGSYDKVSYVKSQCHQLVHVIGRAGYEKYDNLSDTFSNGDKFCWSGYYHGAIEQLIKDKGHQYVLDNADAICAPIAAEEKYTFYHYNCVHGLGHGFMFVQDGELFKSLKSCDKLSDSWERYSCYGGVFMQNIMNSQGPDADPNKPNAYLRTDEPMYPCTAVERKYKPPCYQMQTSHALQLVGYDFKKGFEQCSLAEDEFRNTCYGSLGRDASGSSISDIEQSRANCMLGPDDNAKRHCILGAAADFVSYFHSDQQALELCASLPEQFQSECSASVKNYYSTF